MKLEPNKTALLTLDMQKGIFELVPGSEDACLPAARKAVETARQRGFRILHVGLGFSPGYPELSRRSPMFTRIADNQKFQLGSDSCEFEASLRRPEDLVIYKQRVGGFTENTLDLVLRSSGIENLVLLGIATSGIVLSTIRRAFDLDYRCLVIKDACFDRDPEVHRVLTEKVFAAQGRVLTADELASENR